ncbi:MAG: two-component regulator propeller domain-containing protein [Calditrichia bacterium]
MRTDKTQTIYLVAAILICMLIRVPGLMALDPSMEIPDYVVRSWHMPQNTVNTILQTKDGYIWMGTPSGLLRFDGIRFRLFSHVNTPALGNDRIQALHEDLYGRLWVGTDGGGLTCRQNAEWKTYTTKDGLSNDHIRAITSDRQGYVWIGTDYGLNRFGPEGFVSFTNRDGLSDNIITSLAIDSTGTVWAGTLRGGLASIREEVIQVFDYDDGLTDPAVITVASDHFGNIWIGTLNGLYTLQSDQKRITRIPGTDYTPISCILEDSRKTMWIGTMADGLKRMANGRMSGPLRKSGYPAENIRCLLADNGGNLWLGTEAAGLMQLKNPLVRNITRQNGLPEAPVSAVLEDSPGHFWVGTRNSGLCLIKNDRVQQVINTGTGLTSNRITALYSDVPGDLWIGTRDGGLNHLKGKHISSFTMKQGLASDYITCLLKDGQGIWWIGTDNGLNRMAPPQQKVNPRIMLAQNHIRCLRETPDGSIFAGTRAGAYQLKEGIFRPLLSPQENSSIDALSIYAESDSTLLIGTNGGGLILFRRGKTIRLTTSEGLPDNHIFSIAADGKDNLWMSSDQGVFKLPWKSLLSLIDTSGVFLLPVCFDESDGMVSGNCSSDGQPAVWKSVDGLLYYPTARGVSVFNPPKIPADRTVPRINIESMQADGNAINTAGTIELPYPCSRLIFHFTALDFSNPQKIRFRYKLEGKDTQWINHPPNQERTAEYLHLSPGKYRFVVLAASNGGTWNESRSEISFAVQRPFYRTALFWILSIFSVLGLTGIGIRNRRRKARRKMAEKYKTSALNPERVEEIIPRLVNLMENDKLYLNPNLTLKDLSAKLRIHYNHLSQIINERFGMSYNDFINRYRISEVRRVLESPASNGKTILEIMYDTGFYSKSVFNTAFKKFTGMTPSEYKKNHSIQV